MWIFQGILIIISKEKAEVVLWYVIYDYGTSICPSIYIFLLLHARLWNKYLSWPSNSLLPHASSISQLIIVTYSSNMPISQEMNSTKLNIYDYDLHFKL